MQFIEQGGWMMWPLLITSILACTIIIERYFFFSPLRISPISILNEVSDQEHSFCSKLQTYIQESTLLAHPSMNNYKTILLSKDTNTLKEAHLYNEGETILSKCNYGLDMLHTIVHIAPLMGLLGTVIGMIDTFSRLANQQNGVDIGLLSGGIWQALITTATGLIIAILALFAHQYFLSQKKAISENLEAIARISLACTE